jgi:hypothetical protein
MQEVLLSTTKDIVKIVFHYMTNNTVNCPSYIQPAPHEGPFQFGHGLVVLKEADARSVDPAFMFVSEVLMFWAAAVRTESTANIGRIRKTHFQISKRNFKGSFLDVNKFGGKLNF